MPKIPDCSAAIASATAFLAGLSEPQALVWLELMHRRFGVAEFNGSLERFDHILKENPEAAPKLRLFRRIADPESELNYRDLESVAHPSDGMIVSALYCDRLDLPPSFAGLLDRAVNSGGYYCSHALLAWIWMEEYGGDFEAPEAFAEKLYRANAEIVNDKPHELTDLKLEAAAFLYLAGEGARIEPVFVETTLKMQNPDGGWGMTRAKPGSDWHGSVLGLLLLLGVQRAPTG